MNNGTPNLPWIYKKFLHETGLSNNQSTNKNQKFLYNTDCLPIILFYTSISKKNINKS